MKFRLLIVLLSFIIPVRSQTMAGTNVGSVVVNNVAPGTAWAITSYSYAEITMSPNNISKGVVATDFGFTVPATATIVGIEAIFSYSCSWWSDTIVRLVVNNLEVGLNKGSSASLGCGSRTYGDSTDLWGTVLTPSDVNSPNFGFAVYLESYGISYPPTLYLHYWPSGYPFQMNVYYSTSTGLLEKQSSMPGTNIYFYEESLLINSKTDNKFDLAIYDMSGRLVWNAEKLSVSRVSFGQYPAGIYYYIFKTESEYKKGRFLKN